MSPGVITTAKSITGIERFIISLFCRIAKGVFVFSITSGSFSQEKQFY